MREFAISPNIYVYRVGEMAKFSSVGQIVIAAGVLVVGVLVFLFQAFFPLLLLLGQAEGIGKCGKGVANPGGVPEG
ncbi:MAG: hypothetical protein LUI09_03565 [Prevotellaceae bacterium]|nr:hypothetical protein [Prevotellaceae bacterium]